MVLGLVTSKGGEIIDLDQLCPSPQCGFASAEQGNILTEAERWAKMKRLLEVAREAWRQSYRAGAENTKSTFPGIPFFTPIYPEGVNSKPPATIGPAAPIEPPLPATPFTVW